MNQNMAVSRKGYLSSFPAVNCNGVIMVSKGKNRGVARFVLVQGRSPQKFFETMVS